MTSHVIILVNLDQTQLQKQIRGGIPFFQGGHTYFKPIFYLPKGSPTATPTVLKHCFLSLTRGQILDISPDVCLLYDEILTRGGQKFVQGCCSPFFWVSSSGMAALIWWNTDDQRPSNVKWKHEFPQWYSRIGCVVTDKRWPRPCHCLRPAPRPVEAPFSGKAERSSNVPWQLVSRRRKLVGPGTGLYLDLSPLFFLTSDFIDLRK